MIGSPVADFDFHHLALLVGILKVERRVQHVGRLLIIIEHKVTAHRRNLNREANTQPPARDVDLVNCLIADLAITRVPNPMPVVVKTITRERLQRSRTRPQVIVDT